MKVILKEEVKGLGKIGEVVDVATGYGRNFLLPRHKAVEATAHQMRIAEQGKKVQEALIRKSVQEAQEFAQRIAAVSLTLVRQVGEGDRMFGSVTSRDIVEALEKEGIQIDKRQVHMEEPLRELGLFDVPLSLHPEVSATVKVWVVKG
jgi:large subunit ribosomal protein L9